MHCIGFKKFSLVIILMCFISFAVISCEKNFQSSEDFNKVQIRAKRSLSIAQLGKLADRIKKLREDLAKERVTDSFKDPSDPDSFGKK